MTEEFADQSPSLVNQALSGERSGKVLSNRTIALCAAAVALLAGVAGWVLLDLYGAGGPEAQGRLDAIRTVGTIVLGGGGAIALLLAARRQQTAEQDLVEKRRDLAHKERVHRHAEEVARAVQDDAQQRRITELYTAAANQLGSDKAPVRLAGLYALERLAQTHPAQRQTIVNVFCAYLRMPYQQPDLPQFSNLVDREVSGSDAVVEQPVEAATRTETNASTRALLEEREVRLTVQQLLASHLRPAKHGSERHLVDLDKARCVVQDDPDQPVDTFWPHMDLDLTGAVLLDLDMRGCHVRKAAFNSASFHGQTHFDEARLSVRPEFENAHFQGDAWFNDASFANAIFWRAQFDGRYASFTKARFYGAIFTHATFNRESSFTEARFAHHAWFGRVRFGGEAGFSGAHFGGEADFINARFDGNAFFSSATFTAPAERSNPKDKITNFKSVVFAHGVPLEVRAFWSPPEDDDATAKSAS